MVSSAIPDPKELGAGFEWSARSIRLGASGVRVERRSQCLSEAWLETSKRLRLQGVRSRQLEQAPADPFWRRAAICADPALDQLLARDAVQASGRPLQS